VVNTLLDTADNIPSSKKCRRRERKHVFKVLRENGYLLKFLRACDSKRKSAHLIENKKNDISSVDNNNNANESGFVVLPYIKGLTEKLSRVL
jgi:hypothetical protein